jgi:hypothetical protein
VSLCTKGSTLSPRMRWWPKYCHGSVPLIHITKTPLEIPKLKIYIELELGGAEWKGFCFFLLFPQMTLKGISAGQVLGDEETWFGLGSKHKSLMWNRRQLELGLNKIACPMTLNIIWVSNKHRLCP